MSASGSTVFIVGRYDDLFTRLYDFDIAGADPLFFDYSRISIHKTGFGSAHRQLRVEGVRRGRVGYWQKDSTVPRWRFTATVGRLVGDWLRNPARTTPARGLGVSEDRRYAGTTAAGDRITVPTFNAYCTPAQVQVRLKTGESFALRPHTVDNIRPFKQPRGLSTTKADVQRGAAGAAGVRGCGGARVPRTARVEAVHRRQPGRHPGVLKFRHQSWVLTR